MIPAPLGAVARFLAPAPTARLLARLVLAVLLSIGVTLLARPTADPGIRLVDDANPLAGATFYVNPASAVMRAAQSSDPPNPQLAGIANTPQAYWMDQLSTPAVDAKYIATAQAAGTVPILALYAIPHRDCGSFSAGGFSSADGYRGWIDTVAADIGGGPATVILEPDALAMADCLSPAQRTERVDLMRYAVDTLTRNPATTLYVDAGHSRWVNAPEMASRLERVGVEHARGFSLNTANFFTTDEETGYGEQISGLTGGSHYVIDTSRNGAGPVDGPLSWCNPGGRALGVPPTTDTAGAHTDAYLWVKRPGESDGSCGRGQPGAGRFVSSYAIDLARNAGR